MLSAGLVWWDTFSPVLGWLVAKLKNKSCAKKRFRITARGRVVAQAMGKRHNLRKRPQKMKRSARGTMLLCASDVRRVVRYYMPGVG